MWCVQGMLKSFNPFCFYFQDITFPVKVQTVKTKLAQHIFLFLGMYAVVQNVVLFVLFKNGVMARTYDSAVGAC